MSSVGKIQKKTDNRYLNFYEMEATFKDGSQAPYYMASRNVDPGSLKAVTHQNKADGVVIYSVYGGDRLVLIRQFRFPVNDYVYEFPAGLVDPGEDAAAAAVREMYEETGLAFTPREGGSYSRPFYTTVGMTDEACAMAFGTCKGTPNDLHQESSEEIQVVLADRQECRRILKEENVAVMCAYMLMHFIADTGDPLDFLNP